MDHLFTWGNMRFGAKVFHSISLISLIFTAVSCQPAQTEASPTPPTEAEATAVPLTPLPKPTATPVPPTPTTQPASSPYTLDEMLEAIDAKKEAIDPQPLAAPQFETITIDIEHMPIPKGTLSTITPQPEFEGIAFDENGTLWSIMSGGYFRWDIETGSYEWAAPPPEICPKPRRAIDIIVILRLPAWD